MDATIINILGVIGMITFVGAVAVFALFAAPNLGRRPKHRGTPGVRPLRSTRVVGVEYVEGALAD
jgi:NADH:ubiquinone oxidoreductase subunit 6 (subunit J)